MLADDRCNNTTWTLKGPLNDSIEICVPQGQCVAGHAGDVICQKHEGSRCKDNNDCGGENACRGGEDDKNGAGTFTPGAAPGATITCKTKGYVPCKFSVDVAAGNALNCKCTCGSRSWVEATLSYRERDTGYLIHVTGGTVVVADREGREIKRFDSSAESISKKISAGEWTPVKEQ